MCSCDIDPRERQAVRKLDRYELEDRYLRVLDEANSLKKASIGQEEKLKKLATKLMRFGVDPRASSPHLADDEGKLFSLETENAKLRDKVTVLKSQLINGKICRRSPSRNSRAIGLSSGQTTCRSENSRGSAARCTYSRPGKTNDCVCDHSVKIQEMEAEKQDMASRIAELQVELAGCGNRRDKVAENIGHIRFWRQMKRQSENLIAARAANDVLNEHLCQLKNRLEDSLAQNKKLSAALQQARAQRASDSVQVDSSDDLKDRDERIADLVKELGILEQHNQELRALGRKFADLEKLNRQLSQAAAEQSTDRQLLRNDLDREKASVAALQAANDQLVEKLHVLQTEIDQTRIKSTVQSDRQSVKAGSDSPVRRARSREAAKKTEARAVQTDSTVPRLRNCATQTETAFATSAKASENESPEGSCRKKRACYQPQNSLSREGMLRLLDQAQINAPLESQARMTRPEVATTQSSFESMLFGQL